jgi:hypothetical protein
MHRNSIKKVIEEPFIKLNHFISYQLNENIGSNPFL